MKSYITTNLIAILLILFLSIFYISGIQSVPFHPDESTQIYMSSDLKALLRDPSELFWSEENIGTEKQIYHTIDAPITRYVIGLMRLISKSNTIQNDWNWGSSWEENEQSGAMPDQNLLYLSRFGISMFVILSLFGIYECGKIITGSNYWATLSILFLGFNSLVLLHTRRAMSEGILLFSCILFLYIAITIKSNYWLLSIPAAIAFNTKQISIPLLLVGFIIILVELKANNSNIKKYIQNSFMYFFIFSLIYVILNPYLWQSPFEAITASINNRQILLENQIKAFTGIYPTLMKAGIFKRAGIIISNLFITPPSFSEIGNYLEVTKFASTTYLINPLNNLLRGMIWGSMLLIISIFGLLIGLIKQFKNIELINKSIIYLLILSIVHFVFLSIFIKLPFQRYVILLVPFQCLCTTIGTKYIFQEIIFKNGI